MKLLIETSSREVWQIFRSTQYIFGPTSRCIFSNGVPCMKLYQMWEMESYDDQPSLHLMMFV